jgi:hypothetical protein
MIWLESGLHRLFLVALRAEQWVGFPDFLDEFAPLFGRDPAGLERGNVDDLARRTTKWRELDSQSPIWQRLGMEITASSFKLRANAP